MPYCPRCGVEVDAFVRSCPLCKTEIPEFKDLKPGERVYPGYHDQDPSKTFISTKQLRHRAFLLISALFITAILIVFGVDFAVSQRVTWSANASLSLFYSYGLLCAGFFFYSSLRRFLGAHVILGILFLKGLEVLNPPAHPWFLTLGLPMLLWVYLLAFATGRYLGRPGNRGYDAFGMLALNIGLICFGIDMFITHFLTGLWIPSWSLIILLCLIPVSLFFMFLHYGLHRSTDVKRVFHI